MTRIIAILIFFAGWTLLPKAILAQSLARQTLGVTGAEFQNQNLRLNYTLGEPVAQTITASGISLTQGFQQGGNLISVSRPSLNAEALPFRAWPNPASFVLNYETPTEVPFTAELFDLTGRKVLAAEKPAGFKRAEIRLNNLAAGAYLFRLKSSDGSAAHTFRIIKY